MNGDEVNLVYINGDITNEKIEKVIFEQTGDIVSLNDKNTQTSDNTGNDFKNEVRFL